MSVCCGCCVLSGRGFFVGPITRQEESYRVWCVCDHEASIMGGSRSHWGLLLRTKMKPTDRKDSVAFYPTKNFGLWKKYETAFRRHRISFNGLPQRHENRYNKGCEKYRGIKINVFTKFTSDFCCGNITTTKTTAGSYAVTASQQNSQNEALSHERPKNFHSKYIHSI